MNITRKIWQIVSLLSTVALLCGVQSARAEVFYGITSGVGAGIYSVDSVTGGPATLVTSITNNGATLATRPSDGMLFWLDTQAANPNLWRWDPSTPATAPVLVGTSGATIVGVIRLGFDAANTLFALNSGVGSSVWTLNQNTGAILTVTPATGYLAGTLPGGGDICLHPTTGVMYMVAAQVLYTITSTGVVALVGNMTGLPGNATGCAFSRLGQLVVSPNATLYSVNTGTLAATIMPAATGVGAFQDLGTSPDRSADLRVSKTASNATPGNTVSFTITVTNDGPNTATDVRILDALPVGLTFVSATASQGTYSAAAIVGPPAFAAGTWRAGTLNNGATATLTINATVAGPTAITNWAQVSYVDQYDPDSTPGSVVPPTIAQDDQASVTITPSPDLKVVKTATSSFAVGTNATYSIAVNNLLGSLTTAGTYTVIDNMPAGLTIVGTPTGAGWTCTSSTLVQLNCTNATAIAAGGSNANAITLTVLPDATATPSVTNTATVSGGGEPASNNGNNSSAITTAVCAVSCPDLVVNKTLSTASLTVGVNTSIYTLSVTNNGGMTTGVNAYTITDPLPTGLTLAAAPTAGIGWTCTANTPASYNIVGGIGVSCTRSTAILPAGTSTTVTFPVNVLNAAAPSVSNAATVAGGGEPAAATGNNTTTLVTPVIDFNLIITKTKTVAGNFVMGTNASYTLSVGNIGGKVTSGIITVSDTLPTGVTFVTAAGTGWTCGAVGQLVTCTLPAATTIAAGTPAAPTLAAAITLTVTPTAASVPSISNTASVSNPNESSNLTGNNSSTVITPVNAPDVIVTKSHNGNFTVGVNNFYTLTAHNIGLQATTAATLTVTDTLPAGLTFVSAAGTGWTCTLNIPVAGDNVVGGQRMVCTSTTAIAASTSAPPITLTVLPTAAGATASPVTNNVSIAGGNEPAPNSGNNTDSDITNIYNAPTITKSFLPTSVVSGVPSTLTLTIGNPAGNSVSLIGAAITDNFPAGMSVASTPAFSSSCGGTISSGNAAGDTSIVLSGGGPVAAGGTCVISVNVVSSTIGANLNTTLAVSSTNTVTGGTANATLTVTAPGNPILTKVSSPNPVKVNQASTLTFTITNKVTATADMGFTDTLPAGVIISTPATFGGTCTSTGGAALVRTGVAGLSVITVTGVDLLASASCTVTLNIQSATPNAYPNTSANISALLGGLTAATLSDTLIVERPILTKAFSPASIPVNAISVLTFTITNGSQAFGETGLAFSDALPAGVVLANATTSNTCSGTLTNAANTALIAGDTSVKLVTGTLALGQTSCTISVNVTSATAATYTNLPANVTLVSANLTNNANASLVVTPPPVLSKAFSPVEVGVAQISTLTFTVTNAAGNPAQSGLVFTDTLSTNLVLANGTTSNTCNGTLTDAANNPLATNATSIKLAGGSMSSGTVTCTITVNVLSNTPAAYVNNSTNITGIGGGLSTTGLTSTLTVRGTTLTKVYSTPATSINAPETLTFTITNSGGNPAQSGLSFTDTLAGIKLFAAPVSPQCGGTVTGVIGGSTIGFSGGSLTAGVASCTIVLDIYSATTGTFVNNSGNMSGLSAGMTNSVNATIVVNALPGLTKAFSVASMGAGQTATLTFTVTNSTGAPAQTGRTFSDAFPANLLIAAVPNVVNGCGGTPTITATAGAGTFVIGGTGVNSAVGPSTCTISVDVTSSIAGSYVNGAAQVTTANMNNDVTNQTLTVTSSPSLMFFKTVVVYSDPANGTTDPKFIPGAVAMYTLRVINSGTGSVDLNTTVITDPIPANTALFVNDIGGTPAGPVSFTQGVPSSTLTYTAPADVSYSNDGGTTWTYVPVAGTDGCDPLVTNFRLNPKGTFVGSNASFDLNFRVCVK
jgi:mucin-19